MRQWPEVDAPCGEPGDTPAAHAWGWEAISAGTGVLQVFTILVNLVITGNMDEYCRRLF